MEHKLKIALFDKSIKFSSINNSNVTLLFQPKNVVVEARGVPRGQGE